MDKGVNVRVITTQVLEDITVTSPGDDVGKPNSEALLGCKMIY